MAVQPIDWNAGGNVSLGDLYTGRRVRNEERRVDAYEQMAGAQAGAMEEAQRRKRVAEQADWIARTGAAILNAPPDQRPNLYGMALEDARARGYDTSKLPPQYDAATEGYIRFNVDKVKAFQQQTRRGRGGAPSAGGAGGGFTLDAPYQPQAATPPDAAAAPPVVQQPAPASVPPLGATQPRPPVGATARPGMAPAPPPGDITSTGFGQQPPAPVGPAPGALPSQQQGGPAPSVTLRMPPPQPALGRAQAPPEPIVPVQDSGQDAVPPRDMPAPPPKPGPALELGDRIVRGRNGAPRVVGGMIEVRDKDNQPAFRPIIKPQTAQPQDRPPPAGWRWNADRTGHEPVPGGKFDPANAPAPKVRPLTDKAQSRIEAAGKTTAAFVALTDSFKDDYAGYGSDLYADARMAFKSRLGTDVEQVDWWKAYQEQKNIIRHELFGAALTVQEKAEFAKSDIKPSEAPSVVKKLLNRRSEILLKGLSRTAAAMQANGYSRDAIESAIGLPLESLPKAVDDTPETRAAISRILGLGGGASGAPAPASPPGAPDLRKKYGLE